MPFLDRFAAAAARWLRGRRVPVPLRARGRRARRAPGRPRPAAGAVQRAARRLGPTASAAWPACPGREDEFRRWLRHARCEYAQALSCPRVHVMAGLAPAGVERAQLRADLRQANLAWAAKQAASAGVDVLIEPINTRDIPGFFLNRQDEAHRDRAGGRRAEPEGADGPVPLPDRRGRRGDEDPPVPADRPRRSPADRRRARAPRARHRRGELPLPVRGDRRGAAAAGTAGSAASTGRAPGTSAGLGWLRRERARR